MFSITAVLQAKPGEEAKLLAALLDIAVHIRASEPGTLGLHVSRDLDDSMVFTTYERFANRAAMDAHNGSDAVARFFHVTRLTLDGPLTPHGCGKKEAVTRCPLYMKCCEICARLA